MMSVMSPCQDQVHRSSSGRSRARRSSSPIVLAPSIVVVVTPCSSGCCVRPGPPGSSVRAPAACSPASPAPCCWLVASRSLAIAGRDVLGVLRGRHRPWRGRAARSIIAFGGRDRPDRGSCVGIIWPGGLLRHLRRRSPTPRPRPTPDDRTHDERSSANDRAAATPTSNARGRNDGHRPEGRDRRRRPGGVRGGSGRSRSTSSRSARSTRSTPAGRCSSPRRRARARPSSPSTRSRARSPRAARPSTRRRSRRCRTRSTATSFARTAPTRSGCSPATTRSTATRRSSS